jgi:hypothetical protein
MWSKNHKLSLILVIYQILFWGLDDYKKHLNVEGISSLLSEYKTGEFVFDATEVEEYEQYFLENKPGFDIKLQENLLELNKTYLLTKSVLYTFLIELNKSSEFSTKSVPDYLRLTQDLAGPNQVSLVHAVVSKFAK